MAKKSKFDRKFFEAAFAPNVIEIYINQNGRIVPDDSPTALKIRVKHSIDMDEASRFVDTFVSMVFGAGDLYQTHMFDLARKKCLLWFYTNLALPEKDADLWKLLCNTDLYSTIYENISYEQYDELVGAAREKIEERLAMKHSAAEQRLEMAITHLESIEAMIGPAFEGVDVKGALDTVGTIGGMDQQELMKLVLGAMKS